MKLQSEEQEDIMDTDDTLETTSEGRHVFSNDLVCTKGTTQERKEKEEDRCQSCLKTFKNLLQHFRKSKKCKVSDLEIRKLEERSKIINKDRKKNWESLHAQQQPWKTPILYLCIDNNKQ